MFFVAAGAVILAAMLPLLYFLLVMIQDLRDPQANLDVTAEHISRLMPWLSAWGTAVLVYCFASIAFAMRKFFVKPPKA
jgi:hypothetical protein